MRGELRHGWSVPMKIFDYKTVKSLRKLVRYYSTRTYHSLPYHTIPYHAKNNMVQINFASPAVEAGYRGEARCSGGFPET